MANGVSGATRSCDEECADGVQRDTSWIGQVQSQVKYAARAGEEEDTRPTAALAQATSDSWRIRSPRGRTED